ncbi:MAG TPA: alanine--tRNA ligase-related protein [Ktedonobacteraceae bacterium]|jgi:alanyl-tRNA synthetase|nr:alanine--tRNA ligase-related protein [Ktedonobacteraceae bacterium]
MSAEKMLSSSTIVSEYLDFFRTRGHAVLPTSPLAVPGSSTSFVIAGMQPLLPYLLGQEMPLSARLAGLQRCLRTDDVDAVGLNGRKNTSFFMLGNWSIGDYEKREAIAMALELLLERFALKMEQLWVTIFAGDSENMLLLDEVAWNEWVRLGIPKERIVPLGREDNFWMHGVGACGPCSEIFVDRGVEWGCGSADCRPGCDCERFLEIWNLVFMEYKELKNGMLQPLPLRNIDTGMGLERMAAVAQNAESVFTIDLFLPAQERLAECAPAGVAKNVAVERRARRMIVDHVRAALLASLAGVSPGRDGRSSVVRRLIRRAARQGRFLGLDEPFLYELLQSLAEGHQGLLSIEEQERIPALTSVFVSEERQFSRVLSSGLRFLEQLEPERENVISGKHVFQLQAEKGFPADLAVEILAERGLTVSWPEYEYALAEHREVSRHSISGHFRTV